MGPRADRCTAWAALAGHWQAHGRDFDLRAAFARDAQRFARFALEAPEVRADLSKNLWDLAARSLLLELACECGLAERRAAMYAGAAVNPTEGRAALHTALRAPRGAASPYNAEVHTVLDAMLAYAERVRAPASGIRDVVHIGIGGSELGPRLAVQALAAQAHPDIRVHFVANVDGHDIEAVLAALQPARTLFIIASKTFTTQETMANAQVARDWFLARGGRHLERHFVALTTNVAAAAAFGIDTSFGFWDWVGGRYSLCSAIGLPLAIAIGAAAFRELLAGAHAMDCHYAEAPPESNLPLQLGLLDVWYRNFHGFASRCVAPYHQGLARLPAYLQQLEMESNGKRVDLAGELLPYATSPVVWGEPGTNAQHAYFQLLHQGSDVIPVDFVLVTEPAHGHRDLHHKLLANALAQAQALMLGRSAAQVLAAGGPGGAPAALPAAVLAAHRSFPGNRPSTTLLLRALTPRALGALLALHEHRVFTSAAVWGINPFDQWGVELGKTLAGELLPRLLAAGEAGGDDGAGLDGSTAGLLAWLRERG